MRAAPFLGLALLLGWGVPANAADPSETSSKEHLRTAQQLSTTLLTASRQGHGLVEVKEPGLAFGSVRGYDAADVKNNVEKVQTTLIDGLARSDLKALKVYTQEFFPKPLLKTLDVPKGADTTCSVTPCPAQLVEAEQVAELYGSMQNFVDKIAEATAYRVAFAVRSEPVGARFSLQPVGGGQVTEVATNGPVGNIFRGLYRYTVERQGFKKVEATLNLVDNSPDELYCELVEVNAKASALPCLFGLVH